MQSRVDRGFRLGLRARLTLWTIAVLALALGTGFAWVHHGLRSILQSRDEAFLIRKGSELSALVREEGKEGEAALDAEIRREVEAYQDEGLFVVVRRNREILTHPPTELARDLAARLDAETLGPDPRRILMNKPMSEYMVIRVALKPPHASAYSLDLALSLSGTEAILAQFERRAAAGGLAFLVLAVAGGLLLARQALRPVAQSIATAQSLNPSDLRARLPRNGSGDEIDRLAGTINDLLDRLAEYHAQASRFTADASHELRSPLSAMRAAVEIALQKPRTNDEYRGSLESLGEQCDRLTSLVNGLLLLARADGGQVDLRRETVDLACLVVEACDMYQPLAEERGIDLATSEITDAIVPGDPSRLRQMIVNLLDNAIKFTETGGTIRVAVERVDLNGVRITVKDTGVGIPRDSLPHIFDRFYQADPARAREGSGLGLSICRWIAEAHGGTIRAESGTGQGARFLVDLPGFGSRGS